MAGNIDAFEEWASRPFAPTNLRENGSATSINERVACALEYIAAQLGEISRKLDHIGSGASPSREDFDAMNDLLKKL